MEQERGRARAQGGSVADSKGEREGQLGKRHFRHILNQYLTAAADDDVATVEYILRKSGSLLLGDHLLKPFTGFIQYAPRKPDTIRAIFHAAQEASIELPDSLRLLNLYQLVECPKVR